MKKEKKGIKHIYISVDTWEALAITKAILRHRSFDQTIKFLIKYYREHEKAKEMGSK